MQNTNVYPDKIKEGSYTRLCRILRFPANLISPEMDGQVCRVTATDFSLELTLSREAISQYRLDTVLAVWLLENDERDFIVLGSFLESLEMPVISPNGQATGKREAK